MNNSLTACIDNKVNIDTVYLDLAKAFDKVPHQRLLSKLKAHGVDGLVCNWIKAWLADSNACVLTVLILVGDQYGAESRKDLY